MKFKLPTWVTRDWRGKLVVLGMMIAGAMLYIGWLDLRAEGDAMLKYEKEMMKNVNCFPTRPDTDKGV